MKKRGHGLRRRMTFYLVFLTTIFLTLAAEMTSFLRGARVTGTLRSLAGPGASDAIASVVALVTLKVWVLLGILLAALALVFLLFMKKVTGPLQRILEATDEISAGNLSVQISAVGADELGRLAQVSTVWRQTPRSSSSSPVNWLRERTAVSSVWAQPPTMTSEQMQSPN